MTKLALIPLDPESWSRLGMEFVLGNYQQVVSNEEFMWLSQSVYNQYIRNFIDCDDDVFIAAIVDFRFLFFIIQHAHLSLIVYRATQLGSKVEAGREAVSILRPDWQRKSSFTDIFGLSSSTFDQCIRDWVRPYRDTWCMNSHSMWHKVPRMMLSRNETIAFGISRNTQLLLKERDDSFTVFSDVYPYELENSSYVINRDFRRKAQLQFVGPIWSIYEHTLKHLGMKTIDDLPFKVYLDRLGQIDVASQLMGKKFDSGRFRNTKIIRTIGNSSAIRKLASLISLQHGVEVESYSHGYDQGLFPWPPIRTRYIGSTRFVLPSKLIRDDYRQHFSSDPVLKRISTEFVANKSNQLYLETKRKISSTSGIPSADVMIIGWPFNANRYLFEPSSYWHTQLDLQYRLLITLKKFGLSVIYKAHPDRINSAASIFSGVADEVNIEILEEVWSKAKVFLFTSPVSTAIGYLSFTPRPIVLIDQPGFCWHEAGKKRLGTRCKILSSQLSDTGRILYCDEELYQAVTAPYETSDEFINHYKN